MAAKFEAGQTVYDERGEKAEYVALTGSDHIVRPLVEAYDDDQEYDHVCDPVVWRHVFSQPPVAKYSDELKVLHEQIAAAKTEREQAERDDRQIARERAEKFKRFAVLDNLEAFIDGKITHYVEQQNYGPPKITTVAQEISNEGSSWDKNLRLLTLGGSLRTGEIRWSLNHYSDGSGSGRGVQPCTSYEQAEGIVRDAVSKHFAHNGPSQSARQEWIDGAEKFGIAVPESYRRALAKERLSQIENNGGYNRKQAKDYAAAVQREDNELAALRAYLETPAEVKQTGDCT